MYTQPNGGSNQDIGILNSQNRSPLSNVAEYDGLTTQYFEWYRWLKVKQPFSIRDFKQSLRSDHLIPTNPVPVLWIREHRRVLNAHGARIGREYYFQTAGRRGHKNSTNWQRK